MPTVQDTRGIHTPAYVMLHASFQKFSADAEYYLYITWEYINTIRMAYVITRIVSTTSRGEESDSQSAMLLLLA